MDAQQLINALFGLCGALAGIVIKTMWSAITALQRDLVALQDSIGKSYVRRDDFKDHATRVETLLDRIYEKLDAKADKP